VAGDYTITGVHLLLHPEIVGAMRDEGSDFLKTSGIEQKVDAFVGSQFAFAVLLGYAVFTPASS